MSRLSHSLPEVTERLSKNRTVISGSSRATANAQCCLAAIENKGLPHGGRLLCDHNWKSSHPGLLPASDFIFLGFLSMQGQLRGNCIFCDRDFNLFCYNTELFIMELLCQGSSQNWQYYRAVVLHTKRRQSIGQCWLALHGTGWLSVTLLHSRAKTCAPWQRVGLDE